MATFKIITLASSLEEKTIDLEKDTFYDGGSVNVDGARIKCWKHGGHGAQTFLEVVQNSCNPGFVELGRRLGTEKLFKYINTFGFGEKTSRRISDCRLLKEDLCRIGDFGSYYTLFRCGAIF